MSFNKVDYEATKNIPIPLGVGQTWQDVTQSRAGAVVYTNTTGRPIMVTVGTSIAGGTQPQLLVGGVRVGTFGGLGTYDICYISAIVPNGVTYQLSNAVYPIVCWSELR